MATPHDHNGGGRRVEGDSQLGSYCLYGFLKCFKQLFCYFALK